MNLMVVGGYKNANATNPKGGYWEPSAIAIPILDHRNGYCVRLNMVALKYPYFKKNVDLDVHVKMFM
jgi:hypothetical protein